MVTMVAAIVVVPSLAVVEVPWTLTFTPTTISAKLAAVPSVFVNVVALSVVMVTVFFPKIRAKNTGTVAVCTTLTALPDGDPPHGMPVDVRHFTWG